MYNLIKYSYYYIQIHTRYNIFNESKLGSESHWIEFAEMNRSNLVKITIQSAKVCGKNEIVVAEIN